MTALQRTALALTVALAAAVSTGCRSKKAATGDIDEVSYMVSQGFYGQAVRAAKKLSDENPDDPKALAAHKHASIAYLLEEGRRLTFAEDDVAALESFDQALAIDPTVGEAHEWVAKTRKKLATTWYSVAQEAHASDDLRVAAIGYEKSLIYDPTNEDAAADAEMVARQLAHRRTLSEDYYNDGIQNLRDYRLYVARSRFDYSKKYSRDEERTARRIGEVDVELSKQLIARGQRLESNGFYAAARVEFREALKANPENAEAEAGLARMTVEAEAHEMLKGGDMWLRRGEWDKARETLEAGRELSVVQKEKFEDVLLNIDDARMRATYKLALSYEHDFRYEEAIVEYDKILEEREYFEDTLARITTLRDNVKDAKDLYARAEATEDPAERVELLRQLQIVWPEYKDSRAQLDMLGEQ